MFYWVQCTTRMLRDTPMFELCAVSFGVIGQEAETLVKHTKDVLHVWMYAYTRVYDLHISRQVILHYIWKMLHNSTPPNISDIMMAVCFEDQNRIFCWVVIVLLILFNINGIIAVVLWFFGRYDIVRIVSQLFVVVHLRCWCNGNCIHNHVSYGLICYSFNTYFLNSIY